MKLIHKNGIYQTISVYGEWQAKEARFRWNPKEKFWWTDKVENAYKLVNYADEPLRTELTELYNAIIAKENTAIEESKAVDANIEVPVPEGYNLYPFQKAGVSFIDNRGSCLVGDEMGLGKTIQAIGVVNLHKEFKNVLVICPASLKVNWKNEFKTWMTHDRKIQLVNAAAEISHDDKSKVVIMNFDIVHKFEDYLREIKWDMMIVDECHFLKNNKTRRAGYILGKWNKKEECYDVEPVQAERKVFMTGTPVVNRPKELYTILQSINHELFGSFFTFGKRYCAGYNNGYGWNFDGASNLDELQRKLRSTIMLRRLKKDVLKELPAKRRQLINLPVNGEMKNLKEDLDYVKKLQEVRKAMESIDYLDLSEMEYNEAVKELMEHAGVSFEDMARIRRETAVTKIPYVIGHVKEMLEEVDKVLVFAHHHEVLDAIYDEFKDVAVKLDGRNSIDEKAFAEKQFQTNPDVKVFVGGMKAAGFGLTLTAASHVVFAELDWVPGNVNQAEDRVHRISQEYSVLIQHIMFDGTIDSYMAEMVMDKQKVIDAALDDKVDNAKFEIDPFAVVAPPKEKKKRKKNVRKYSDNEIAIVHAKLKNLTAMCDGAMNIDDCGFNKIDTNIGRSLAWCDTLTNAQAALGHKIVKKYHRQVGRTDFD